jgi:ketosteroid isomerase-like protein
MRARSPLLYSCFALLGACHIGHHTSTNARKDVDEIKAGYAGWKKAFEAKDLNGVMALYAPEVVAYDLVPPLQYDGADDYRKDYANLFAQFNGPIKVSIPRIHIEQSGTVAFAFGLERVRGTTADGKPIDMWMRFTDGWERRNGEWLIAHEHVSVPVDVATGKVRLDLTP